MSTFKHDVEIHLAEFILFPGKSGEQHWAILPAPCTVYDPIYGNLSMADLVQGGSLRPGMVRVKPLFPMSFVGGDGKEVDNSNIYWEADMFQQACGTGNVHFLS